MSNVPKLRFKEFSGEWEEKQLGEIANFHNSKRIPLTDSDRIKGIYPYYGASGIIDYVHDYIFDGEYILLGEDGANIVMRNSRLAFLAKGKFWLNNHAHIFQAKESNSFLCEALERINYTKYNTGSAQPKLNAEIVKKIKLNLPQKQEQEKIASFLTSVDTKIEQLTKKEALLQQYKKGVMQKIFNQELRFKADDGSEFCDWEEEKIGNLFLNISGTALEKFTDENASYKFISIGNYSRDGKYIDNGQRIILNDKTETKLLEKDNLVMVLNDKTSSGDIIGSTILIDEDNKYIYNQRSERLICKKNISSLFYWHFFNSKLFRKEVFSISQGGTQIYINFSAIKLLNIPLPSLKEQTKIANFLSSIDNKIEQTTKQLNQTKEFKKALLQTMFV